MALRYIKNVSTLKLDTEKCTGCGMCRIVCPHGIFSIENGKARILDKDLCMECGACMMNCAFGALTVQKGVGCAAAIIIGKLRGTEPTCGCGDSSAGCCGDESPAEQANCGCGDSSKTKKRPRTASCC